MKDIERWYRCSFDLKESAAEIGREGEGGHNGNMAASQ